MDMEVSKIQALVKTGRQIIYMTLQEILMNSHKKRASANEPTAELSEEAAISALALTVQLLAVSSTLLPTPSATLVLALLYT